MTYPYNTTNHLLSQSLTFRDAKGNTGKVLYYFNWNADADLGAAAIDIGTVNTAIVALSNAAIQRKRGVVEEYGAVQYGTHATGGAYEAIIDKAVMVLQDASGGLHHFEVPAPKIAIFMNDKITVNPANSLVIAFITAMTTAQSGGGYVTGRSGLQLVNYMGGFYKARKIRRRLDILVLQPDLTASLPAE